MRRICCILFALSLAAGLAFAAETWKNAPLVDANCAPKVKADPDAHTKDCVLGCAKSGVGILTADGTFLKFDKSGSDKALAALKASKKTDHIRAMVTGERKGDTIKVQTLALD